ncbi:hypothetical protein G6M87_03865 [Rhizobium rhizogenes]|uniref:hypothetical protein n=1 Tax=Rhizobium TaxID=379 RepID=UPI00026EDE6F|nr:MULTISPECIES: hypothetical protein [Rhizobium]EJK82889.1 hypothetical protein PMI03_03462 [Rhizobium sp. AP16]NTI21001.1 hypothetical protein [Rhizobium rhizogenes]QTG03938.1 hypothetical protein G6M87_03865 [Rhizobium rhizogenes]
MKYEAWTWKAIEGRIIEMADTLRMTPSVSGPANFVSLNRHGFTAGHGPQATAATVA